MQFRIHFAIDRCEGIQKVDGLKNRNERTILVYVNLYTLYRPTKVSKSHRSLFILLFETLLESSEQCFEYENSQASFHDFEMTFNSFGLIRPVQGSRTGTEERKKRMKSN